MIGKIKLIEDLGVQVVVPGKPERRRFGLYRCPVCLKNFKTTVSSVKQGVSKCKKCANKTHGDSQSNLYKVWLGIKDRCLNPNNARYLSYGGRGITVCKEWIDDYLSFKEFASLSGYKEGLSIDRIDNDGNYEPSNCRWTSNKIQARNTRKIRANNKSGYRGVSWNKDNQKWRTQIMLDYKQKYLGSFTTPIEAARAYDNYIIENSLEHTLNFKKDKQC